MTSSTRSIHNSSLLLPERLIAVFGTESSGSTFAATTLGVATGAFQPTVSAKQLRGTSSDPLNQTQVMHISMPTGYAPSGDECRDTWKTAKSTETVAVLVPKPCRYDRTKKRNRPQDPFPKVCKEEAGLDDHVRYPHRYFVNITSHILWYQERGVNATAVLITRDSTISKMGKLHQHCPNANVTDSQNQYAWELMNQALERLRPPSIVLMSYEALMSLQEGYLFDIYRQLGITSTYVPEFRDANAKYVLDPYPDE